MKKFIVACNNGVATSQTIASKVQDLLDARGVSAKVDAVDIRSIDTYLSTADAYICVIAPDHEFKIPVINGIAFLTGINEEDELQKLIDIANT